MTRETPHYGGALVGWTAENFGDRLSLRLQTVAKPTPHEPEDITTHIMLLTRTQAAQLGHTLFGVSGQTPPQAPRRSWLGRLLGP